MVGESSGSVSVDVEMFSLGGKEHRVQTGHGSVSVVVFGDHDKPALVTYPDVAMTYMSCCQRLFFSPQATSLLLHNFCLYHICPPGHEVSKFVLSMPFFVLLVTNGNCVFTKHFWTFHQELPQLGAAPISADVAIPSVNDLADQVADVLDFFCIGAAMCLGVTAGAYILSLFAMKHRERVIGLILVSPLCKSPSWTEWLYNKACRSLLDEKQNINVLRFLQAINGRHDITDNLKDLHCRTLIFIGENSPFHSEALYMASKLDKRYCALVDVQACGSVVTEERPDAMAVPLEYFLMGYGLYKPYQWTTTSPRSPLSPSCISPELLSPESMGLKLKPIKTRV